MASFLKWHRELTNGVGKCSVPMWMGGCPAGFCDEPAYGERPTCSEFYSYAQGRRVRSDGKYDGYVPSLACQGHGGPAPLHFGDPCIHCGIPHDDVPRGPCTGKPLSTLSSTDRETPK